MRILMVCYEFPPLGGGGSRAVYGLSTELIRQGHHVDLVTMGFRSLPYVEEVDGIRVHRVPNFRMNEYRCTIPEAAFYLALAIPKVRQLALRYKYDINHTHFILPDGILSWLLKRQTNLPYVITAHGSDVPGYNPDRLDMAHKISAFLWKRVTGNANKIVCPSRSLQSLIMKQNKNAKTLVIPYGFKGRRFRDDRKKEKRILVVTRILRRKGVQYLLGAVRDLNIDYEIHIVGDGPFLPALKKMASRSKTHVQFWGWLDNLSSELNELFETSRIFVLTSEAENFPVALMEAMAAGLAIITTKNTGCAEVVGCSAVLVSPRNSQEIREALLKLTTNSELCAKLGQQAVKRIRDKFTWGVVTKRYVDLYREQMAIKKDSNLRH